MNSKKFFPIEKLFDSYTQNNYQLLPFRFNRIGPNKVVAVQESGEYVILSNAELTDFVNKVLPRNSSIYQQLKAKHFLYDDPNTSALELLSLKVRTKYSSIRNFTNLHMFVVTLRCDYSCPYCQVSRQTENKSQYDMTEETALKSLDFVFNSPNKYLKIEFQGGEPLLAFDMIKFIVNKAHEINKVEKRNLQFVIATNSSFIDDEVLEFCEKNKIYISTSLDGPKWLHDKNRPRPGRNGYEMTIQGINRAKDYLGPDSVSALMTTTSASLVSAKDIVDEYLKNGFSSIFLRPLSPYGFAVKKKLINRYDVDRWFEFYKEGLDYILQLNKQGVKVAEFYTSIILKKILSPFPTSYVDLQSPTGAVTSAVVFNYEGSIYASDEGRMLAEMDDDTFKIGHVLENNYEEVIGSEKVLDMIERTENSSVPKCSDCAYQKWCGTDPAYHYATQQDVIGHKEFSGYCRKNTLLFEYLIDVLENDPEKAQVLKGWVGKVLKT